MKNNETVTEVFENKSLINKMFLTEDYSISIIKKGKVVECKYIIADKNKTFYDKSFSSAEVSARKEMFPKANEKHKSWFKWEKKQKPIKTNLTKDIDANGLLDQLKTMANSLVQQEVK